MIFYLFTLKKKACKRKKNYTVVVCSFQVQVLIVATKKIWKRGRVIRVLKPLWFNLVYLWFSSPSFRHKLSVQFFPGVAFTLLLLYCIKPWKLGFCSLLLLLVASPPVPSTDTVSPPSHHLLTLSQSAFPKRQEQQGFYQCRRKMTTPRVSVTKAQV